MKLVSNVNVEKLKLLNFCYSFGGFLSKKEKNKLMFNEPMNVFISLMKYIHKLTI